MSNGTKVIYLTNKDLLEQIHQSKTSYCEFIDKKYHRYDLILENQDDIFKKKNIKLAKETRAIRLAQETFQIELAKFTSGEITKKPKIADFEVSIKTINTEDLVFRVYTYSHIPLAPGRKKNPKKEGDKYAKLNFMPFKHFMIVEKTELLEVGRSHTKNNEFSLTHGKMTPALAKMLILLVQKYSQSANWRNYSYIEEFRGQALLQLSQVALQFNELLSSQAFSYLTQISSNSFTRILNIEKQNQNIRDDLLQSQGKTPSFTRQLDHDEAVRRTREADTED